MLSAALPGKISSFCQSSNLAALPKALQHRYVQGGLLAGDGVLFFNRERGPGSDLISADSFEDIRELIEGVVCLWAG